MSSCIAGTSGCGGAGAGCANVGFGAAAAGPFRSGATTFAVAGVGTSGFTAAFPIFGAAFSPFPAAGSGDFTLALVAGGVAGAAAPPVDDATAGSVFGSAVAAGSFFASGVLSVFGVSPAGVLGTIDAILSFSTSTYPKSVLTLNMLSSYPTITPYSFLPSFKRISSARAEIAAAQKATANAETQMRLLEMANTVPWWDPCFFDRTNASTHLEPCSDMDNTVPSWEPRFSGTAIFSVWGGCHCPATVTRAVVSAVLPRPAAPQSASPAAPPARWTRSTAPEAAPAGWHASAA